MVKKPSIIGILFVIQVLLFWYYLFFNIANIGEDGVGLPILVGYTVLSSAIILFKYFRTGISIKLHLVFFLLLIFWICIRFIVDYGNAIALKQFTIATTGGMLLFFILGLFLRETLNMQRIDFRFKFIILGVAYLALTIWILDHFSSRMLTDLFLIDDTEGSYQRPGNFMSMSFIVLSYIYFRSNISYRPNNTNWLYLSTSTGIYLSCAGLLLLGAQLMGSNSATAIVAVFTLLSISICFLLLSKRILKEYKIKGGRIFRLKNVIFIFSMSFVRIMITIAAIFLCITWYLDLDITQTRIFGFGEFESSSLSSRGQILSQWGLKQILYAPFLGNVNVAYLVTGDAGTTLHNFFPDILASLGIVGLITVLTIFFLIMRSFYKSATRVFNAISVNGFIQNTASFYSFAAMLFLLIFANISVGFSWPVIWFAVGFYATSLTVPRQLVSAK